MDCSYDSDSCERKPLFCSEPLQTFGLALGCSACLKASYHSNRVRARKKGHFRRYVSAACMYEGLRIGG